MFKNQKKIASKFYGFSGVFHEKKTLKVMTHYWVNLSKSGGKDGVLRGAALPARGKPRPSRLLY